MVADGERAAGADLFGMRLTAQGAVFAAWPRRLDLIRVGRMALGETADIRIHVYRNHAFEYIASAMTGFANFSGLRPTFTYSDYDDSLSFALAPPADAQVVLFWIDFGRYEPGDEEVAAWFLDRVRHMRALSDAAILIAPDLTGARGSIFSDRLEAGVADLRRVGILPVADALGPQARDALADGRLEAVGATRFSDAANLKLAQSFGLSWLPALTFPPIKAITFDLDHTLWRGVLGEDGPEGVEIDAGYRALHDFIRDLAARGVLIAILSKNLESDVEAFFARHSSIIKRDQLAVVAAGWDAKSAGMAAILDKLRIGADAMLFVDDNPGELAEIARNCAGVQLLHAQTDPHDTLRALNLFPGLFRWEEDDAAAASSPDAYLRSLAIRLTVRVNPTAHVGRLAQISQKTNQFNLNFRRLNELDVERAIASDGAAIVGVWLTDRFSDSGLIAAIAGADTSDGAIRVDDVCVSCRALGRGVDDDLVAAGLNALVQALAPAAGEDLILRFAFATGPRNGPALDWLRRLVGGPLAGHGEIDVAWARVSTARQLKTRPFELDGI